VRASRADSTRRAYGASWRRFEEWCVAHGLVALPTEPHTVALYAAAAAERYTPSTLAKHLAAISRAHQAQELSSPTRHPTVLVVLRGVRRQKGTAQQGKAALLTPALRAIVTALPDTLLGTRDRALLLVGFAGGFRRSELVGLDVEAITFVPQGLVVRLAHSKTDQDGQGRDIGIPAGTRPDTCPVRALRAWLDAAGITEGPIFRRLNRHGHVLPGRLSDRAVARVVQSRVAALGLDPAGYAGHSLRSGLATSAAAAGASERAIMATTGHRSVQMVRRYIRAGTLFDASAALAAGL